MFTDASFGNLSGRVDSCGGEIVFLVGHGSCCAISWRSGKIQRVVKSTLAAEGLSLSDGLDEAVYVKRVLCELMGLMPDKNLPIIGVTDHEGLFKSIHSTKLVGDRRLRIDLAAVKESLDSGLIKEVKVCDTKDQVADVLTKKGVDGSRLLSVLQTGFLSLQL